MWTYRAVLVRLIDADTYLFDLDLGFHVTIRERVRLLGANCPERNTAQGRAAIAYATGWFDGFSAVQVKTQRTATGEVRTFERYVASVCGLNSDGTPVPGADLAASLKAAGFATAS